MAKVKWTGSGDYAGPGGLVLNKGQITDVTDAQAKYLVDAFGEFGCVEVVKDEPKKVK